MESKHDTIFIKSNEVFQLNFSTPAKNVKYNPSICAYINSSIKLFHLFSHGGRTRKNKTSFAFQPEFM